MNIIIEFSKFFVNRICHNLSFINSFVKEGKNKDHTVFRQKESMQLLNREEVPVEKLRVICDYSQFEFESTEEVTAFDGIIGQERATKAMNFGLSMKMHGYNIFMTGMTGTGKTSYACSLVNDVASAQPVPDDWCYVYNFKKPDQPLVINLPGGKGYEFCKDIEELLDTLKAEIPKVFEGDEYEKQKTNLVKEFQDRNKNLLEELNTKALEQGFMLKRINTGFATVPLINGKPLTPEEFEQLDEAKKKEIEAKSTDLQVKALEILRKIQFAEKEIKSKAKDLDRQIGLFAVGHVVDYLKDKYQTNNKVQDYLSSFQDDVLDNLDLFKGKEEVEMPFPFLTKGKKENEFDRYQVNLFIDHRETKGAPVVIENNPTYYNLMGRMEYENALGVFTTSFLKLRPGAFHKANGGYLILQAKDVLTNVQAWEALKRVLKTKEIRMENIGEQLGLVAISTLKPSCIPVEIKVIMVGNPRIYQLLYHYDEDFKKLFKIKADFDSEMTASKEHIIKLAQFISYYCKKEKLKHFDRNGVAKIVEYSYRLSQHQNKLSTRFNDLVEVLIEANVWANLEGAELVQGKHVSKAIEEKNYRSNRIDEKMQEITQEGHILIETSGEVIGQVNGLAVLNTGDYSFGRPSKITANTFLGKEGVINIERESKLSGKIHNKGVLILSGYLASQYAQDIPLAVSISLGFEQSYDGVDGDSASSTELYAIMSSLSGFPLKQSIAVTGSVNQKGEIQPIGGVNEKVEGFFALCKARGLDGTHGVMIPHQNVANLMLIEEIVEAAKAGLFHVYPVKTIDQGIETLTGIAADEVHFQVKKKLQAYAKALAEFANQSH